MNIAGAALDDIENEITREERDPALPVREDLIRRQGGLRMARVSKDSQSYLSSAVVCSSCVLVTSSSQGPRPPFIDDPNNLPRAPLAHPPSLVHVPGTRRRRRSSHTSVHDPAPPVRKLPQLRQTRITHSNASSVPLQYQRSLGKVATQRIAKRYGYDHEDFERRYGFLV